MASVEPPVEKELDLTVAPLEPDVARETAKSEVDEARRRAVSYLTEHSPAALAAVIDYLLTNGIRSEDAIADALMSLIAEQAVALDDERRMTLAR